jgi:hypothetical protein
VAQGLGHVGVGPRDLGDDLDDIAQRAASAAFVAGDDGHRDARARQRADVGEGVVPGGFARRGRDAQSLKDRRDCGS